MERRRENEPWIENQELELSKILSDALIKATDTYSLPPQIIWIDNSTIATFGNFSASTGKAKSKKTFNLTALVAASLANKQILQYRAKLPEGKRRILYVDTEQSRYHCRNVLDRILRLAGLPSTVDNENLDFIGLREYSPSLRIKIIDYALCHNKGYGLVIIDGIRDLMLDINNAGESVEVINKLMQWSSIYDLHIHCVLHLNKGDDNVRGHIGTELNNKAETVLVISKSNQDNNISEVRSMHIRDKDFSPFAFRIDENGLPEEVSDYSFDQHVPKKIKNSYTDLTEAQHRSALEYAFDGKPIKGFDNMIEALIKGYAAIGFERKRSITIQLLQYLQEDLKMIVKQGKCYHYETVPMEKGLFENED